MNYQDMKNIVTIDLCEEEDSSNAPKYFQDLSQKDLSLTHEIDDNKMTFKIEEEDTIDVDEEPLQVNKIKEEFVNKKIVILSQKENVETKPENQEDAIYKCSKCLFQTRYKAGLKIHLFHHKEHSLSDCEDDDDDDDEEINIREWKLFTCSCCSFNSRIFSDMVGHLMLHKKRIEFLKNRCNEIIDLTNDEVVDVL